MDLKGVLKLMESAERGVEAVITLELNPFCVGEVELAAEEKTNALAFGLNVKALAFGLSFNFVGLPYGL